MKNENIASRARTAIIVLGMHRSGTSATAGLLSKMGCDLPNNLMPANEVNSKGFFESNTITLLNDAILASAGMTWFDQNSFPGSWYSSHKAPEFKEQARAAFNDEFGASGLFVLKDPRHCRLVPFWEDVFTEQGVRPVYVFIHRNPTEVAASLQKGHGTELLYGQLLWLRHVLDAEITTRGKKRVFVSYDQILSDWRDVVGRISNSLDLVFPRSLATAARGVHKFLSGELKHFSSVSLTTRDLGETTDWLMETWEVLNRWSRTGEDATGQATFDNVRNAMNAASATMVNLANNVLARYHETKHQYEQIAALNVTLTDSEETREWQSAQLNLVNAALAELKHGGAMMAEEMRQTEHRPLRPLKRAIQRGVLKFVLLFGGLMPEPVNLRLRRSLAKRKPRRHVYGWSATVAKASGLDVPVDPLLAPRERQSAQLNLINAAITDSEEMRERRSAQLQNLNGKNDELVQDYLKESKKQNPKIKSLETESKVLNHNQDLDVSNRKFKKSALISAVTKAKKYFLKHFKNSHTESKGHENIKNATRTKIDVVQSSAEAQPEFFLKWTKLHEPNEEQLSHQISLSQDYNVEKPMITIIIPVFKVPPDILECTIKSVRRQTWQNWEICLAYADIENVENWNLLKKIADEEPRLKIECLSKNFGISGNSNAALEKAKGEFVALLDHDDELTPWALYDMAMTIQKVPNVDFLYSDKDSINADGTLRQNPLFKPKWSPEMMYSANYLTHFNVMRRSIVQAVGGWNNETDGAQDWDIFLRVIERSRKIERITSVHYHWRIIEGSTATGINAKPYALTGQLLTLQSRVARLDLPASIQPDTDSGYKIVWQNMDQPLVDLIIHGEPVSIEAVEKLLQGQSDLLIASVTLCCTSQTDLSTKFDKLFNKIPIYFVQIKDGCKTSAIDKAISAQKAPTVLLISALVIRLGKNTIKELSAWVLKHPEIAFASALIQLENEIVVEAGQILGDNGVTQPLFRNEHLYHYGVFGGPLWHRNVSAAGDFAIAFKRDRLDLSKHHALPFEEALTKACVASRGETHRGVVVPPARAYLGKMPKTKGTWSDSMKFDPYFHPAFCSVLPIRMDTN